MLDVDCEWVTVRAAQLASFVYLMRERGRLLEALAMSSPLHHRDFYEQRDLKHLSPSNVLYAAQPDRYRCVRNVSFLLDSRAH